ncbi:MAG: hypothetical protein ACOH5I_15810 [Oligoflexus sp.]
MKKNRSICRVCRKPNSESPMGMIKSQPRGICIKCRRLQEKARYYINRLGSPSRGVLGLCQSNMVLLSVLKPGTYKIRFKNTQKLIAYVAVKTGSFFFQLPWGGCFEFFPDIKGIAAWLANRSLCVTDEEIDVLGDDREIISADHCGAEEIVDVSTIFGISDIRLIASDLFSEKFAMDKIREPTSNTM